MHLSHPGRDVRGSALPTFRQPSGLQSRSHDVRTTAQCDQLPYDGDPIPAYCAGYWSPAGAQSVGRQCRHEIIADSHIKSAIRALSFVSKSEISRGRHCSVVRQERRINDLDSVFELMHPTLATHNTSDHKTSDTPTTPKRNRR